MVLHTMKHEVGPVCRGQMHFGRWHSPGLCHTRIRPSLAYRQNLLSSLKTTEHHSTLHSILSRHQSSRPWRCRGVGGSLASGTRGQSPAVRAVTAARTRRRCWRASVLCVRPKPGLWVWEYSTGHLRAVAHHRYIVLNMYSNPSICPSIFLLANNAAPSKWLKLFNRRGMVVP